MMFDRDARYLRTHEWAKKDGSLVAVGLTAYAVEQLGDIVYMELPEVGKLLNAGEAFGVVESVKSASEMNAPVGGTVVAANTAVCDNPDILKKDAYGIGWLIKLEPADAAQFDGLMDADAYRTYLDTEA